MKTLRGAWILLLVVTLASPLSSLADTWEDPVQPGKRFTELKPYNDQAVRDNETGLVWEKAPETGGQDWATAQSHCNTKAVGNRKGWRLPTIQELASLVDPGVTDPSLPSGHPFFLDTSFAYWSATSISTDTSRAWGVLFSTGAVVAVNKATNFHFLWCVRGGQGVDPQ